MFDEATLVGISGVVIVALVVFLFLATAFTFFMYVFFKNQWGSNSSAATAAAITRYQLDFAERDSVSAPRTGLDPAILQSLPVYTYCKAEDHSESTMECAVCLSEIVDGEKARLLPKCNHGFHLGCIDMWFHSHSTCPLCRNPVDVETPRTTALETPASSSSSNATKSEDELVIDIPSRQLTEDTKPPMVTRLKSFKRLFSIGNSSTGALRLGVGDNNNNTN